MLWGPNPNSNRWWICGFNPKGWQGWFPVVPWSLSLEPPSYNNIIAHLTEHCEENIFVNCLWAEVWHRPLLVFRATTYHDPIPFGRLEWQPLFTCCFFVDTKFVDQNLRFFAGVQWCFVVWIVVFCRSKTTRGSFLRDDKATPRVCLFERRKMGVQWATSGYFEP